MSASGPRVGVPFLLPSDHPDAVHAAGGDPVPLRLPTDRPGGGVALAREWVADAAQVSCAAANLDALLLATEDLEDLFGMLLAALRLDLPTVCAPPSGTPFCAALTALGLTPLGGDPAGVVVGLAAAGGPRPRELVENFSLANALRAGVAAGGGPELLVHLAAVAREAGVPGFSQMARVLGPETPAADPAWLRKHGLPALLASLGDNLHDLPTVAGPLKEDLPPAPSSFDPAHRLLFVRGRVSGAEAVCLVPDDLDEVAGACRVYDSERDAVRAVQNGAVGADAIIVVGGCGPRGGPGLLRLDDLGKVLEETGLDVPVLTDGLAPDGVSGTWISLFSPEAVAGGVMGQLRDGDTLRIDFEEARIRTGVKAKKLAGRRPRESSPHAGSGYVARYARTALPALEGAGFG